MLQFYVPEVEDVVEVEDEADNISNSAFDDLMSKIRVRPNLNEQSKEWTSKFPFWNALNSTAEKLRIPVLKMKK